MNTPYVAIGNNELGKKLSDFIDCPHCGKRHRVQDSTSREVFSDGLYGPEKKIPLQFYKCTGHTYLCGINGKEWK